MASYCHETKLPSPSSQNLVAASFPEPITKECHTSINKTPDCGWCLLALVLSLSLQYIGSGVNNRLCSAFRRSTHVHRRQGLVFETELTSGVRATSKFLPGDHSSPLQFCNLSPAINFVLQIFFVWIHKYTTMQSLVENYQGHFYLFKGSINWPTLNLSWVTSPFPIHKYFMLSVITQVCCFSPIW